MREGTRQRACARLSALADDLCPVPALSRSSVVWLPEPKPDERHGHPKEHDKETARGIPVCRRCSYNEHGCGWLKSRSPLRANYF